ncbi:MAG: hypothetical protein ACLPMG_22430 [Terriglobales bacterium]
MTCMTFLAQPMAMATTQLARITRYEVFASRQEQNSRHVPRMNWIVVTGTNGKRVLRMQCGGG